MHIPLSHHYTIMTVSNGTRNGNGNGNGAATPTTAGHEHHFGTRLIHAGSEATEDTGAVIPAINLSTTYKQSAVGVHKVSMGAGSRSEIHSGCVKGGQGGRGVPLAARCSDEMQPSNERAAVMGRRDA